MTFIIVYLLIAIVLYIILMYNFYTKAVKVHNKEYVNNILIDNGYKSIEDYAFMVFIGSLLWIVILPLIFYEDFIKGD